MLVSSLLSLLALPVLALADQSFLNTALVRTIDLGGATSLVTTTYTAKSLSSSPEGVYEVLVGRKEWESRGWFEVREKRAKSAAAGKEDGGLRWTAGEYDISSNAYPITIFLPSPLAPQQAITLTTSLTTTHASQAKPASISQTEDQFLLWKGDAGVQSRYETDVARIKIRSPSPTIVSHSKFPDSPYIRDSTLTKSGATLTLGPYHDFPGFTQLGLDEFEVHYKYDAPLVSARKLKRAVEISHWGDNLNVQDDIELVNSGPTLKGQFSRIAHLQGRHYRKMPPTTLSDLTLKLPAGARDPYFYDIIGNVSTSNFRSPKTSASTLSAASKARGLHKKEEGATLELKPRYPVLGGWNYTFTVGWDQPLSDSLKVAEGDQYVLGVPFVSAGLRDLVWEDVEFVVILPEGATDVEVVAPFPLETPAEEFVHTAYLDTLGRPAVRIVKKRCVEQCATSGLVYVSYKLTTLRHWQKTIAITTVPLGAFFALSALRRAWDAGDDVDEDDVRKVAVKVQTSGKKTA